MNKEIAHVKNSFLSLKSEDKKQILDHHLPGISNIISYYGILAIKILPSQTHQTPRRIQNDDIELDISKVSLNVSRKFNFKSHKKQTQFSRVMFSLSIRVVVLH